MHSTTDFINSSLFLSYSNLFIVAMRKYKALVYLSVDKLEELLSNINQFCRGAMILVNTIRCGKRYSYVIVLQLLILKG